ncbi:MAG TPA: hypothetical protein VFP92_10585 [Rhodanobacteraceae bacterium]|nr:hypothetical protein [Rhodanobacteraceae bacterium]
MSNDKLAEALRDSTFVAAMLDAICETDGTVDRMRARDAAYRVREALQAHAAEAAQAAEPVALLHCCGSDSRTGIEVSHGSMPEWDRLLADRRVLGNGVPVYLRPQPVQDAKDAALLGWAVSRWNAEVLHHPLVNVHRRTLDDTWRQVIRHAGGDDVVMCGPRHDDLAAMAKESGR